MSTAPSSAASAETRKRTAVCDAGDSTANTGSRPADSNVDNDDDNDECSDISLSPQSSPEPQQSTGASNGESSKGRAESLMTAGTTQKQDDSSSGGQDEKKPRLLIQRTHAAFISKLYAMVNDSKTDRLISWTEHGDSFQVMDPMELSQSVLPQYFKHGNWQSFVRQLNMYGFHKVNDLEYGGIFGETQLWMFKHPRFLRGETHLLKMIKRRGPGCAKPAGPACPADTPTQNAPASTGPTRAASPVVSSAAQPAATQANSVVEVEQLHSRICQLENSIYTLQRANRVMHDEYHDLRAAHMKTQDAFAGVLRFLESTIAKPASRGHHGDTYEAFQSLARTAAPLMAHTYVSPPPPPVFTSPMAAPPASQPAAQDPKTSQLASARPEARRHEGLRQILPKRYVEPGYNPLRVPSLSPPTPRAACGHSSDAAGLLRKRRSNSSGSNMSSISMSSSSESGDNPTPSPDSLAVGNAGRGVQRLPPMRVVLPPISGMIDGIGYNGLRQQQQHQPQLQQQQQQSLFKQHQPVMPILPPPASLQSLRETLGGSGNPAKRSRID
ncbi:Flocculation suppression protein [Linderina macrospora]|uniref:Flocculation suppression protein n=1 Tax=Linderina macrospora TaxID=4868 RepID=A0ACC1J682_9FUNG|nr:Flocculation suppression protein [Linderina macrospora]